MKEIFSIVRFITLFVLAFTIVLRQMSCTQQIAGQSVTSSAAEKVRPMDEICDLTFTGENIGDDAHTTTTGDIDGDGYADLIVGAMGYNNYQGSAYLYWGSARESMDSTCDLVFKPPDTGGLYSVGMACGDIDNDGYKDVIIRANTYGNIRGRAYLSKGADVNAKNNDGQTPLWYAKDSGYTHIVELLRKHGAKE